MRNARDVILKRQSVVAFGCDAVTLSDHRGIMILRACPLCHQRGVRYPSTRPHLPSERTKPSGGCALGREERSQVYSHNGPIIRGTHGYILTTDQSYAGRAGIFLQRTNRTRDARVYSHNGPICYRWDWVPPTPDRSVGLWDAARLQVTGPLTMEAPHLRTLRLHPSARDGTAATLR
eukprot:1180576-Prorocentrum_minimum.AAC.2